jgi:hypothetical protein
VETTRKALLQIRKLRVFLLLPPFDRLLTLIVVRFLWIDTDIDVTVRLVVAARPASEKIYRSNAWHRVDPLSTNLSKLFKLIVHRSSSPLLFRLTLHRRRVGILELEPVLREAEIMMFLA